MPIGFKITRTGIFERDTVKEVSGSKAEYEAVSLDVSMMAMRLRKMKKTKNEYLTDSHLEGTS